MSGYIKLQDTERVALIIDSIMGGMQQMRDDLVRVLAGMVVHTQVTEHDLQKLLTMAKIQDALAEQMQTDIDAMKAEIVIAGDIDLLAFPQQARDNAESIRAVWRMVQNQRREDAN